jgi:2-succinyl-5-enolpyruvyl-6-hydroxy-3-cyclohexene-1-carboxylate synthase
MVYPKIPLAQSIIEICLAKCVKNIVISPGSRNAPLTIGFVNNSNFTCYSIADERCAAFFALGIAKQIQKPVAVICTSGSALLNYYPAFAEAFYSQIPLIVISADRPQSKIDIGDGQTIRQENVYKNHSLYNANLTEVASVENDLKINKAINNAISKKGPVHINAPFEEPLYETVSKLDAVVTILELKEAKTKTVIKNSNEYAAIWNSSKKKLILVGENTPNTIDEEILDMLAKDNSVVVMTETTSNLHHPSFLNHIDAIIIPFTPLEFQNFRPDILITFGCMVVSKRIKACLRKHQPQHHWHIDPLRGYDTYGCLTKHFKLEPNLFFNQFLTLTTLVDSNYKSVFAEISKYRNSKHKEYLKDIAFSDFKAFELIIPCLPQNCTLHLSNSSPIRYAQLFDVDSSVEVFCNRGTSGIDGSTSTAIGAAVVSKKQSFLITGDIGFLYDSNALWNNYIPNNFKIILINNGGGGIFRILPGHEENQVFNTFFETSHCLTAKQLAKMYGFEYKIASNEKSLLKSLTELYSQNYKPTILEIFTPTKENNSILSNYFKALR